MRISDWSSDVCSSDLPPAAHDHRTRAALAPGRRVRDGRAAQARPRGLRALRLRVSLVRGRRRLPRRTRPPRARPARRRPAAAARRRSRALRQERRQGKEKGVRVTFPPRLTAAEWEQGKVTLTPFSFPATDHAMMARALRLAERGAYTTRPNPMVGCVIARGDEVVGEGWHQRQGGPPAEVVALEQQGDRAKGATASVTDRKSTSLN